MRIIKINRYNSDYFSSYPKQCNWWINNKRSAIYKSPLYNYFFFELDSEFLIKRPNYKQDYSFYLICG